MPGSIYSHVVLFIIYQKPYAGLLEVLSLTEALRCYQIGMC